MGCAAAARSTRLAPVVDRGVQLERERRTLIQAVEERKAARNANSQEVAQAKDAPRKTPTS